MSADVITLTKQYDDLYCEVTRLRRSQKLAEAAIATLRDHRGKCSSCHERLCAYDEDAIERLAEGRQP